MRMQTHARTYAHRHGETHTHTDTDTDTDTYTYTDTDTDTDTDTQTHTGTQTQTHTHTHTKHRDTHALTQRVEDQRSRKKKSQIRQEQIVECKDLRDCWTIMLRELRMRADNLSVSA